MHPSTPFPLTVPFVANGDFQHLHQRIDFDPDVEEMLRHVSAKVAKLEAEKVRIRNIEDQKVKALNI